MFSHCTGQSIDQDAMSSECLDQLSSIHHTLCESVHMLYVCPSKREQSDSASSCQLLISAECKVTQTLWSMHIGAQLQRFYLWDLPGGLPGAGEMTSFTPITCVRHTYTHMNSSNLSPVFQGLSHCLMFQTVRECIYFKRLFLTRPTSLKVKLEQKFNTHCWEFKLLTLDKDYCMWSTREDSLHNESKKPQI